MATERAKALEPAQMQEIEEIAEMVRRGQSAATIEAAWRTFIEKALAHPKMAERLKSFGEIWSTLQDDLSVVQTRMINDLQRDIDRAAYHDTLRNQIRDEIARARKQADAYIAKLEEQLNSLGDDAQLANLDLQNMLQKQQQTLQMLSSIPKMLHDTAMAIIRKIGG